MSDTKDPRQWFQSLIDKSENQLPFKNINWLKESRSAAKKALIKLPIPQRKLENWRYSNINKLFDIDFEPVPKETAEPHGINIDNYLLDGVDSYRLVINNGHCIDSLSNIDGLPEGVKLTSLRQALATDPESLSTWFGHASRDDQEIFTSLNTALVNDGLFVHIAASVKLDKPIEVIYINHSLESSLMIQLRNLLVLENNASATLIERYLSKDQSLYFNNNLTEIVLEESASLKHYRIQDECKQAYHMGSIFLNQKASSVYKDTTISMGGAWARTDFNVDFKDEHAVCHLDGLYMVGDQQLIDCHLNIQHKAPNCASQHTFKGILYGKGRAVFDGLIYVDKLAQGTDAHLSNDNLMLTRKAEVDTKPQLEIYADDVKCSHGTTVGQLEPEQIFYMRSRGIDEDKAHKMLCMGFADEIVNTIEIEALRDYVDDILQNTLSSINNSMTEL